MKSNIHTWKIWKENEAREETEVLFSGSYTKCLSFYKKNGGSKAGLHLGYDIP